jgi:DNA uptake protein ComE-like DNA-binding protein
MLRLLKRFFKAFFTLGKGEQRAILILLIMIVALLVFNLLLPGFITFHPNDHRQFAKQVEEFRKTQQAFSDSIKTVRLQNRGELDSLKAREKLKPFPFDPNDLPEELWKKMGLTDKQIGVIKNFESKGGFFSKKEDLKLMYCLSDAEYKILEPFIVIETPDKKIFEKQPNQTEKETDTLKANPYYKLVNINSATPKELSENLHFPGWLAERVIKYRDLLGGFASPNQLAEVYGFDSNRIEKLDNYIQIDSSAIRQTDLNNCTFKKLLHHPYISYEQTKQIVNFRDKYGEIRTLEELVDSNLMTKSDFIKLKPYLKITSRQLSED